MIKKLLIFLVATLLVSCGGPESYHPVTPFLPGNEGPDTPPGGDDNGSGEGGESGGGGEVVTPAYFSNPLYTEYPFADPSILRYGDEFYCYSTGNNFRIIKSSDMIHWEYAGTVFTDAKRPTWIKEPNGSNAALWGPEVRAIHGQIYFYYTLSSKSGKGIGVATAPSPLGPFTDHGKVIEVGSGAFR